MKYSVLVLSLTLGIVMADFSIIQTCPEVKLMDNFTLDKEKFLGTWYEQLRLQNFVEDPPLLGHAKCTQMDVSL